MSVSFGIDKLFSADSALNEIQVTINGYVISQDDLVSIGYDFGFDDVSIKGSLLLKDSYGLYNKTNFDVGTVITVFLTDKFGVSKFKMFNVVNVNVETWETRFKYLKITFIDAFSYVLSTTYLSKSYNDTPINVFNDIIKFLKMDSGYLTPTNTSIITNDVMASLKNTMNINIPKDRSLLDYFNYIFRISGIRFWQNYDNIYVGTYPIKDTANVVYNDDKTESIKYTNYVNNYKYAFTIFDYRIFYNKFLHINAKKPLQQNYKFYDGKNINTETINAVDYYDYLKSGDQDLSNSDITVGKKYTIQPINTIDNQFMDMEDLFFNNVQLEIIVKGSLKYQVLGKWVNVELKGNINDIKDNNTKDTFHGGFYFVYRLQEKIIGDKFISKLTLIRFNNDMQI